LGEVERPVLVKQLGIIWSQASAELRKFVELTGIPFYTTPQGRGVIPDDHAFLHEPLPLSARRVS
jgi:thiamine pyrophosphate-dependent acetolactate synthase large subunit-like protein